MKKIKNPWLHKNEYHCFGCCPDNPLGLKMEFYEEGDEIISYHIGIPMITIKAGLV